MLKAIEWCMSNGGYISYVTVNTHSAKYKQWLSEIKKDLSVIHMSIEIACVAKSKQKVIHVGIMWQSFSDDLKK